MAMRRELLQMHLNCGRPYSTMSGSFLRIATTGREWQGIFFLAFGERVSLLTT